MERGGLWSGWWCGCRGGLKRDERGVGGMGEYGTFVGVVFLAGSVGASLGGLLHALFGWGDLGDGFSGFGFFDWGLEDCRSRGCLWRCDGEWERQKVRSGC